MRPREQVPSRGIPGEGTQLMKRIFDILGAILGLLVLALPLAVLAAMVRLNLGSPILFVQDRPGWRSRIFRIIKFLI